MVSTVDLGNKAETAVCEYLMARSYKIMARNWRTRFCEIDIVAIKDKVIYFVEVKFRKSHSQGDGHEYITPAKLRRMEYSAKLWTARHNWAGEYCLSAASVGGAAMRIDFIEQI